LQVFSHVRSKSHQKVILTCALSVARTLCTSLFFKEKCWNFLKAF
jgi:hypothetical protein